MAFDPNSSIYRTTDSPVKIEIQDNNTIHAIYNGKKVPITLADRRSGTLTRSQVLTEGTGFEDGVVTGFKAYASGLDVGRNEGVFIWKNQYFPGVTGVADGTPWGPPAYQVWAFSLDTGEITAQFTDNGGWLSINATLDWVDYAASFDNSWGDRLYDCLYWDNHVDRHKHGGQDTKIRDLHDKHFYYMFHGNGSSDWNGGGLFSTPRESLTLDAGDEINVTLKAKSGEDFGDDFINGSSGDDDLIAFRGKDELQGGSGNDILRAGNGRDLLNGGAGGDVMFGGFGLNTFEDSLDGEVDSLYVKSDQWAENWLYGSAGNSPNGEKADKIEMLDEFDQIYVQGVETSQLSYGSVDHNSNLGETLSGIGIYASGVLEAVYVGDNLSQSQIAAMTQGIL